MAEGGRAVRFGAIIIGDEILSGKRRDGHLAKTIEQLGARGLSLAWAEYLSDEPADIVATLKRTLATADVVFSFGGIGATPDDYTRQAAADALGVPLARHPEGMEKLRERFVGDELTEKRMMMVDFPQGAAIVPNPYNKIPGFAVGTHYFLPGFPEMAWPMQIWVLETFYSHLFHATPHAEEAVVIEGAGESELIELMQQLVRDYPNTKLSSLPKFEPSAKNGRQIELSLRGDPREVAAGMAFAKLTLNRLGFAFVAR
jgi:molybdopterin-biosynthesis enzyme MoeA-like protein